MAQRRKDRLMPLRVFALSRFRALFGPFRAAEQRGFSRLLLAVLLGLGLLYLALLYSSFAWPQDAEALLEPAVRAAPKNPYLKVALAAAYTQQQDWAVAERLLREVRRLAPDDPTLWAPLADLYNQTHREREAAAVAREALALRPNDIVLLNGRGQAEDHLHNRP